MLRRNKKRDEPVQGQEGPPTSPGFPPYARIGSPAMGENSSKSAQFQTTANSNGSSSLYMQGSAPNSSSSNLAGLNNNQAAAPYYTPHHQHSVNQSRATTLDSGISGNPRTGSSHQSNNQNRTIPSSGSNDTMGPPPQPFQLQSSHNQHSSNAPTAPMGRSQSAFNFILSKAKGTFSSGATQQQSQQQQQYHQQHQQNAHPMSNPAMNASSSLSSLFSIGGSNNQQQQQPFEEPSRADNSRTRNRAASSSSSVYAPYSGSVDRSSDNNQQNNANNRFAPPSRPSLGDDYGMPASSPTKRTIFGRERKASNNSITRPERANLIPSSKTAFTHSPLGRNQRQDSNLSSSTGSSGTAYAPFSKSQTDLHSKTHEFPSPISGTIDLPRISGIGYGIHSKQHMHPQGPYTTDLNLLRSPSPNVSYSRSVDDLSRGHTPPPPISPAALTSHGTPALDHDQTFGNSDDTANNATWGEHGVVASSTDKIRASDMGALNHEKRRMDRGLGTGTQNVGMGLSNVALAPSIPASVSMNVPIRGASGGPNSTPYESSRHQRNSSKSVENTQRDAVQSNVRIEFERPSFAPGTQYDGLLNRNTQISMSIHQLNEGGGGLRGGTGREKDISKGWKPFRVTLRDGKLSFYKPPSSVADDVKSLFPTSIIPDNAESVGGSWSNANQSPYLRQQQDQTANLVANSVQGLSVDDIQRNKVGTRDLLAATSGGNISNAPELRAPPRRNVNDSRLSAILDAAEPVSPSPASWERGGRHADLSLTSAHEEPLTWLGRVSGGSFDALTHEYVYATQMDGRTTKAENGAFLFAFLLTLRQASRPLQGFLVALHKWSTNVMCDTSNEKSDTNISKDDLKSSVRERLTFVLECGIIQFADQQIRSSVLPIVEDILRDVVIPNENDKEIAKRMAELEKSGESLDDKRDVKGNTSSSRFSLTRASLLKLDPSELARQIHAFYVDHLPVSALQDRLMLPLAGSSNGRPALSRLISFDFTHPHFLTKLVLEHVLGKEDDDKSNNNNHNSLQEAKDRAALLRHWIAIASYLIKLQNVSAWLAICAALCSRGVARLTLTWRFVAASDRMLVGSAWAPALVNLGWSENLNTSIDPLIDGASSLKSSINGHQNANPLYSFLPYLGNAVARFQTLPLKEATSGIMSFTDVRDIAIQLWKSQDCWQSFNAAMKEVNLRPVQAKDDDIQSALSKLFAENSEEQTIDQNASLLLSLKVESPWLGNEQATSWHPPLSKTSSALALSPLCFKESLPNLSLADSSWIVSTIKKESKDPSARMFGNNVPEDFVDIDGDSTITLRSRQRPTLSASPLTRAKPFGSIIAGMTIRPLHGVPFANIIEWTPGFQAGTNSSTDEMVIRVDTDLILSVVNEIPSSVPSSPMASKRFSQEFTRGSRPVSIASKRSSLPPSERNSLIDPIAAPLQVAVKAATLERLVDVLVMDVQHLSASLASDEIIEKAVLANKRSRLSIDIVHYRKVFLATFRVHCKPIVLFDFLRKRLLSAVKAGGEMALPLPHRPHFPTWSRVEAVNSPTQQIDWDAVIKIRQGIIAVLLQWIASYPQDFVEDPQLYEAVEALGRENGLGHTDKSNVTDEGDYAKLQNSLKDIVRQMRLAVMTSQTEKKSAKRSSKRVSNKVVSNSSKTEEALKGEKAAEIDVDKATAHDIVEYLESVIKVFFEKIDERDLLVVHDLFYKNSHDPLAWHISAYQQSGQQNSDDLPAVNNMYKLLELVRWPSRESQSIYHRLPSSIRDACASQSLLRGWCAVQIIEPRIGLVRRQARIAKLLDALWICRARMCNSRMEETSSSPLSPAFVFQEPTIASFVESVLVGAMTSSESRLFVRAWQQVAFERGGNCDSLTSVLPSRETTEKYRDSAQLTSTLDIGWLLKSMAQAIMRVSDVVQDESTLIDFDKQRTVWTLIESSAGRVRGGVIDPSLVDLAGARLTVIQSTLRRVQWDRRAFKEDNASEAASLSPVPESMKIMRGPRPLGDLMVGQQDKFKRDRLAYDILIAQVQQAAQQSAATRAMQMGGNSRQTNPPATGTAQNLLGASLLVPTVSTQSEKKTRRMTALFRGAVRPMGLMTAYGNNERPSVNDVPIKSFAELLPLIPLQKPSSTISCGSNRISVWRNGQRSFILNLSPAEGGHILLQAHNAAELQGWCQAIEQSGKEYAVSTSSNSSEYGIKKGNPSGSSSAKSSKSPTIPLYGTDLKILAEYESQSVPLGLSRMLEQVEKRGLREQGIYRISGAKSAIEALRLAFNTQPAQSVNLVHGETSDIHTIAGAIKQWFRDLPEPAIPFRSYHALISAERLENEEERLYAIRDIIWDFPRAHFELLKRISEHLSLVCQEGQYNLMAPHNIGLVFGTSLLNPPPGPASVAESFGNIGKAAHIVKILVTMHEWLFEPEPEAEVVPEAELVHEGEEGGVPNAVEGESEADEAQNPIVDTPVQVEEEETDGLETHRESIEEDKRSLPVRDSSLRKHDAKENDGPEQGHVLDQNDSTEELLSGEDRAKTGWLENPLIHINDGTVDSHTSDSSIMRAVLGVNATSSSKVPAEGLPIGADTIVQKQADETTANTIPNPIVEVSEAKDKAAEEYSAVAEEDDHREDLLDVQEDGTPTNKSHRRTTSNTNGGRERVVESVYLDATDAIAVLQNPFEEEEVEHQREEEEEEIKK